MDLSNSYYKRIVYKKNAFDDLKTYIKLNFSNKNVCLITTKSVPAEEVTGLLNAVFCGTEKVVHYHIRNGFDEKELKNLCTKINDGNFNLLIGFGGGKCANVVKYFASNFNLPYIICPSAATSLAYFSGFCINPFNTYKSFNAKPPLKIFIKESVIKNSSLLCNINGLAFLHSLRAAYLECLIEDKEEERYIVVALEKLFEKLENEQTNILLCNEDSNLILMDLFIDFGFFMNMLNAENFVLHVYKLAEKSNCDDAYSGKKLLLICELVLCVIKKYLELNSLKMIEMPNFYEISGLIEKYKINALEIKNSNYFINFMQNIAIKGEILAKRDVLYKNLCHQILKIKNFCKEVKLVYSKGINISLAPKEIFNAIMVAPYINQENELIDFIAGSGILNGMVG